MRCPVCKDGDVEVEFDDPDQYYPEWSCTSDFCPTSGWGIYAYIAEVLHEPVAADKFADDWMAKRWCLNDD